MESIGSLLFSSPSEVAIEPVEISLWYPPWSGAPMCRFLREVNVEFLLFGLLPVSSLRLSCSMSWKSSENAINIEIALTLRVNFWHVYSHYSNYRVRTLKKWQRALLAAVKTVTGKDGQVIWSFSGCSEENNALLVASKLSNKNARITITCGITDQRQYLSKLRTFFSPDNSKLTTSLG